MSVGVSSNRLAKADVPSSQPPSFGLHQVYPNSEEDTSNKDVDVIAIHGLDTQSPRQWVAWKQDGISDSGEVHWLKDAHMLPEKIPNARIFTYDWNANIDRGAAADGLLGFADGFLEALHIERSEDPEKRPILFIASCFGGLLLARALHRASESKSEYHHILQCTAGVIFLGTPFQGSDETFATAAQQRAIVAAMANRQGADTLVSYLQQDRKLDELVQLFCETVKKPHFTFPIICYYETLESDFRSLREKLPPNLASKLQKDSGLVSNDELVLMDNRAHMVPSAVTENVEPAHFVIPFGQNEDFVGRESVLLELCRRILPSTKGNNSRQWTALEGLGGVGKTQIALEAAYRLHHQHPEFSVFWAPAISVTTFENACREIGRNLKIPGIEDDDADVKALVRDALRDDRSGRWLLIVDNVDNVDLISPAAGNSIRNYLPHSRNGSILFTTRNHEVAAELGIRAGNVLRVMKMSQPEAVKLLVTNLQEDQVCNMEKTTQLTDFLTCLPLALKQASMYMYRTGVSTTEYLGYCLSSDKTEIELLSKDFEDHHQYLETRSSIATTWLISFKHITQKYPLAAQYLKFISFLAEKDIPLSILPRGKDNMTQGEAVGVLSNFAFINKRRDGVDFFDIHRLVRLATRNWVRNEQHKRIPEVVNHLAEIYPFPDHGNQALWMAYLPHAKLVLCLDQESVMEEVYLKLLLNVAESLTLMSKYEEAEQMFRTGLEFKEQILGPKHPATLTTMNSLAVVLEAQGQYKEAEQMYRHILPVLEEVSGSKDPKTLSCMSNLAHVLGRLEKYDEAEDILWRTWELRQDVLGCDHIDIVNSLNNLAFVLQCKKEYAWAEFLHKLALEKSMKLLGPEDPATLTSMHSLAHLLGKTKKYEKAEQMHRQTLKLRQEILVPDDRAIVLSMNNLALVLRYRQKYKEAEDMHRQAVELSKKVLGPKSDDTLVSMGNLAAVLVLQKKYESAQEMYSQILELKKDLGGPRGADTLESKNDLASILVFQGKTEEADALFYE